MKVELGFAFLSEMKIYFSWALVEGGNLDAAVLRELSGALTMSAKDREVP